MQWKNKNASTLTKYKPICTTKKCLQFFQMLKLQCEFFFLWRLQIQVVNARSQNLNLYENELRNRITPPRLNNLSLMCTANDILENKD
jgi:hypothetical protein